MAVEKERVEFLVCEEEGVGAWCIGIEVENVGTGKVAGEEDVECVC